MPILENAPVIPTPLSEMLFWMYMNPPKQSIPAKNPVRTAQMKLELSVKVPFCITDGSSAMNSEIEGSDFEKIDPVRTKNRLTDEATT